MYISWNDFLDTNIIIDTLIRVFVVIHGIQTIRVFSNHTKYFVSNMRAIMPWNKPPIRNRVFILFSKCFLGPLGILFLVWWYTWSFPSSCWVCSAIDETPIGLTAAAWYSASLNGSFPFIYNSYPTTFRLRHLCLLWNYFKWYHFILHFNTSLLQRKLSNDFYI